MRACTQKRKLIDRHTRSHRNLRPSILATSAAAMLSISLFVGSASQSYAASASWVAAPTNGNWEAAAGQTNWSTGAATFPGGNASTASTDVATFNSASTFTTITLNNPGNPPYLNISGITFDTAAANYTVGSAAGQAIFLTNAGTIQIASTLTATNAIEAVNAPLVIGAVSAVGTYTLANNSANGAGAGAGTLNLAGTIGGNGNTSQTDTLTLTGSNTNANTISGVISDNSPAEAGTGATMALTKTGAGTWVLGATNTYSGATTIAAGTLSLSGTGSTAAASTVGIGTAGTLAGTGTVNGNATITGGGIVNFGAGGKIVGTLAATGGNWNGAGTVTGAVTNTSGTFTIGSGANLTATAGLTVSGTSLLVNGNAASTLTGSLTYTSTGTSTWGGVIAGAGSVLTVNNNSAASFGQLLLTAANSYGGGTQITSGALGLTGAGTMGSGNVVISNTGSLFLESSTAAVTQNLTINGTGTSNFAASPVGAIFAEGTGGTISGTVTLASNSTIGSTSAASTLNLNGAIGTTAAGSTLTLQTDFGGGGGIINVGGSIGGTGTSTSMNVLVDSATVTETAGNVYNGTTTIRSTGAAGAGILNANVANALPTANGRTAVIMDDSGLGGSTLALGANQAIASLTGAATSTVALGSGHSLTIGTTAGSTTFSGTISGGTTSSLIKDGASTEILIGSNTYSGTTTVTAGILQAANNNALGTNGSAGTGTTVDSGATLQLAGVAIGDEFLAISGTGAGGIGALNILPGATASYAGPIALNGAAGTVTTFTANNGAAVTFTGGIDKTQQTLVFVGVGGGTFTVSTVGISGTDAGFTSDMVFNGGTSNLNTQNTYTGKTWLTNGVIVNANVVGALPAPPADGGTGTVRTGLVFDSSVTPGVAGPSTGGSTLNVNANQAVQWIDGGITGSTINLNANVLTIGSTAPDPTPGGGTPNFAGVIADGTGALTTGGIIKDGTNTQILSGINTYTGATTITGGVLQAGSTQAFGVNSAVTINDPTFAGATGLDLHGFSNTIGSLSDGGGHPAGTTLVGAVTDSAGGAATLTIATSNALGVASTTSFGGLITNSKGDDLSLVISGPGTQSISNVKNTYTGTTTVNAGATLDIDSSGGASAAGVGVKTAPLGPGTLIINAGADIGTGMHAASFATSTIANAVVVNGSFLVSNIVLPSGTLGVPNTGVGAGTALINGPYTPFGATGRVSNGVQFTGPVTLTSGGVTTMTTNSGSLDFRGTITGGGGLAFAGNTYSYIGNARFNGGTPGDAANTYGGVTTVGDGLNSSYLVLGKDTAGAYAIPAGGIVINHNAYVQYDAGGGDFFGGTNAVSNQIAPTANAVVNGTLDTAGLNQTLNRLTGVGIIRLDDSAYNSNLGGAVIPAGTLTVNSGIFNGSIIDGGQGGQLVKNTSGILILTGQNPYVGNTTINGGILQVDGSIGSHNTYVAAGAQLQGIGVIGGNVFNSGTVKPGDSPGTLTVKGNYTQYSSGNLRIELASTSNYGRLQVSGKANLDGTITAVAVNGFHPKAGNVFTVLTAGGGVNGTFSAFSNQTGSQQSTLLKLNVVYDPSDVKLEYTQNSFLTTLKGRTPNETAVATDLNQALSDKRLTNIIGFLDNQSLPAVLHDLDLIAPEELASIYNIGVSLANVQTFNLQRRTEDIRMGSAGFSASGFHMAGSSPSYTGEMSVGSAGPDGPDGKESKEMKQVAPPEARVGVFLSGVGEWVNVGNTFNSQGFELDTGGFTLGVDYKVTPNFAIGLSAGYAHTNSDMNDGEGRIGVDGGKLGLYATYFTGGFYVDTAVNGGYNSYDTRRQALQGEAFGNTDGGELNVLFGTGYNFHAGGWSFGPTGTFQYTYLGVNGFTEHGSLAPLTMPGQSEESIRTALGFKASYDWKAGGVVIRPELNLAWQHEYGDTAYAWDSRFANGAGGVFTVHGPDIGRDSLLLGAGVAVLWNDRTSTYVYYDGEFARTTYNDSSVSGGFRIAF